MNRLFDFLLLLPALILAGFLLLLLAGAGGELVSGGFLEAPNTSEIFFAIRLSLLTATIASLLGIIIAVPVAYLLSRHAFFGKSLLDTFLDLPIILSPIALGALLLIFFNTAPGRFLSGIFGSFVFEVKGIVLAQFCVVVGLAIRLLKTTFEGVDITYEHLARSLGMNKFGVFTRVVLPMSRRGLLSAFLLIWGRAIGEFGATVTLAGATTFKTETLPVAIFLNFESADIANALIFILILVGFSLGILFSVRKTGVWGYE